MVSKIRLPTRYIGEERAGKIEKTLKALGGITLFGIKINTAEEYAAYLVLFIGIGIAGGIIVSLIGVPVAGFVPGLFLAYMLYDKVKHGISNLNKQVMKEEELPALFEVISIAVRAGATIENAVRHAANNREGLAASWLKEALARYDAGEPLDLAVEAVADRTNCRQLLVLARIVNAGRKTREGLADILDKAVEDIWTEKEMEARERAGKIGSKLTFPVLLFYFLPGALLILLPMLASISSSGLF
ncbi:type II secretion system F family protein [Carboxydothermus ferrireducens]|nr:type II secretion system F family protein [Carboxydothermus ferrireducens]